MKLHVCLMMFFATLAWAKGGPPLSNLSVTTDLLGTDASGAVTEIQNDGVGPYYNGVDAIGSILITNGYNGQIWGDWQFDDLSSTTRKVSLSFTNPIQPSQRDVGSQSTVHH